MRKAFLILITLCTGCADARPAAAAPADTLQTVVLAPGATLPGLRHMGFSNGTELWSDGDIWVRVHRVQP